MKKLLLSLSVLIIATSASIAQTKTKTKPKVNSNSRSTSNSRSSTSSRTSSSSYNSSYSTQTSFESESDVFSYLEGKEFYSSNGSVKVSIGYTSELNSYGVILGGRAAYFNLDISVLSSSIAIVKGQSLFNPDGVIKIWVYANKNCLENQGEYFCLREY